jgi:hypothetical protein
MKYGATYSFKLRPLGRSPEYLLDRRLGGGGDSTANLDVVVKKGRIPAGNQTPTAQSV